MAALLPVKLPGVTQTDIWAPQPRTERGMHTQIYLTADGKKISYCVGRNVVIRNIDDSNNAVVYQEHLANTTCASVNPTGQWVASGDEAGKVRVWGLNNPEHTLKIEVPVFNGRIFDICWDPESKRIAAVGSGKTIKGKAFMWDSGNSLGDIDKHDKAVLSCSYKMTRPFKFVTGGEDNLQNFYNGPPFKWDHSNRVHTNYINCVRFSPSGEKYISVSSDKRGIFWDGKTGEQLNELNPDEMHKGSMMAAAWSPDGKFVATAAGDKQVKIWDHEKGNCTSTLAVAEVPQVEDMQCGLDWKGDNLVSLSLNGDINVFSVGKSDKPIKVIQGHQNPISGMAYDSVSGNTFTCSSGGEVMAWTSKGIGKRVGRHSKPAERVAVTGSIAVSVGVDLVARFTDTTTMEMDGEVAFEGGQPKVLAASVEDAGLVVVGCTEGLNVLRGPRKTSFLPYEKPSAIAMTDDGKLVAVGGEEKPFNLSLFKVVDGKLVADGKITDFGEKITAIAFSPNGKYLAVADMSRDIKLYNLASRELLISGFWQVHTARIDHLKFSPDSSRLASCGVDSSIIIWDPVKKTSYTKSDSGHVAGGITGLAWTSNTTMRTSGMDFCIRSFDVLLKE